VPHCCICTQAVSGWVPHPDATLRTRFMSLMAPIGSDLDVYLCPKCKANDRDRHLWLYMGAIGMIDLVSELNVLHIAPEAHIEFLLQKRHPPVYIRGDLYPKRADHQKIDIEKLAFEDEQFHLIICNHVLEHVADPQTALKEFYRCLKPNGLLIAQTPYSPLLKSTFEITESATDAFALEYFGQDDHVRLFGSDISSYFKAAGFLGDLLAHSAVLPEVTRLDFGVNIREPFFAFSKPVNQI